MTPLLPGIRCHFGTRFLGWVVSVTEFNADWSTAARLWKLGAVVLLVFHIVLAMTSACVHSPSVDEMAHLPAGLSHWEVGGFDLYAVNPPLVRIIAASPLLFMEKSVDWSSYSTVVAHRSEFPVGRQFVKVNGTRSMRLYAAARMPLILLVSVIGVLLCWKWVAELSGRQAALAAVALYCLSPAVFASVAMTTPDAGSAVALLGGWWATRRWLFSKSTKSAVVCGLAIGLSLLTKFTSIAVVLTIPLLMWVYGPPDVGPMVRARKLPISLWQGCLVGIVALYVLNSGYAFEGTGEQLTNLAFQSHRLKAWSQSAESFAEHIGLQSWRIPVPKNFVMGIDTQARDFESGYRSYLMGEWKHGGWWYYYLIGFLVKEPIGFQLMLYVSILQGIWGWRRWTRDGIREWSLIVVPPLLIFALVSSQTGFNHHMRYVLPAYPFLFIIAARTVTLGRFWKWFSYACMTWQAASVLWFAPHWMSYFNEAAGGPLNGHKWLVDSNIDWGQDILGLKKWQDQHPEAADLQAALFTGFDPKDIGLRFRLPTPYIAGEPQTLSKDKQRGPQPGWCAISVCQLKGHSFSVPAGDGTWEWSEGHFTYFLDNFEPVDRIGYSIYIYHITEAQAATVRQRLLEEEVR